MSDPSPFKFFLPFILLAVVGFGLLILAGRRAQRRDQARIEELRTWALGRGYTFLDEDNSVQGRLLGWPFESGRKQRSRNVIRGQVGGRKFTALDYSYETTEMSSNADGGSTSRTTTHDVQALLIEGLPSWPDFSVTPKSLGSRIAVTFGGQDIAIETAGFNRMFRVRADDADGARRALSSIAPVLMQHSDQAVRIDRGVLLAHRRTPQKVAELESQLSDFGAALPRDGR
jgi:hypothetical protein